ncbi:MAG: aminotransferase class I/II-fold pyridoxal phosphate-dependent enzyme, partial [Asticcacaulis sp.]|uniref:aminotransferase class I/II-fold pyridoxal phosphate-dependent enzyme n=1 Tax=Asticcacaulis sp. TaxID=1872648 RepID=UPI003F7C474E
AINLGQGFPETDGFPQVREAAARALMEQSNQYAPMRGLPVLRQAVSDFYACTQGIRLDPDREVVVTSGATEAICAALLALITPGDEVVVFEPMYDAYVPLIERAGGVPRIVQMSPPHWRFSDDDLKAAFNDRTRAVLLTTPNNPTTTCLDRAQLDLLAQYCERFDAYLIADEVWEQVVFGRKHLSVLHHDALRHRSIKIGSAGKIFSLTGWKVGFVCAAPDLADQIARAHQFITFATPPALQHGVAYGLNLPQAVFDAALTELAQQRACLSEALTAQGFAIQPGEGTYFLNIDLRASDIASSGLDVAQHLVQHCGLATIPLQAFCPTGRDLPVLRLCFAKSPETLTEGARRLGLLRGAQI